MRSAEQLMAKYTDGSSASEMEAESEDEVDEGNLLMSILTRIKRNVRTLQEAVKGVHNTKREVKDSAASLAVCVDQLDGEEVKQWIKAKIGKGAGRAEGLSREVSQQVMKPSPVDLLPVDMTAADFKDLVSREWQDSVFSATSVEVGNPLDPEVSIENNGGVASKDEVND